MRKNFNTLSKYIIDNSEREYQKETLTGLFRAILEPCISNQKFEASIFIRLSDVEYKSDIIKRLNFSGAKIFSYSDSLIEFGYENLEISNIWKNLEFVIVTGERYSSALLWDFSLSDKKNYSPVCIFYNSNKISEIIKDIKDNSKIDILIPYNIERRDNLLLNQSVQSIIDRFNEKNEEAILSEFEKNQFINSDDNMKTAEIITKKARFIAHEIKNNLSIINLYSKIFEKRLSDITAEKEVIQSLENAIKTINNASSNMSYLIGDLRCLSAVYKTDFDLKELIDNIIQSSNQKALLKDIDLISDLKENIIINSDKTKLECVLINLIYNAIEACKAHCMVRINARKTKNELKITVKNNGEMIPSQIKNKIFEADFTTKPNGNGLGLAYSKSQLQLLGGDVELVCSNEEETVFEVTVRLK